MKTILWSEATIAQRNQALARPEHTAKASIVDAVRDILRTIKTRGDEAVFEYTARFDQSNRKNVRLTPEEIKSGAAGVNAELRSAIEHAKANIETFHALERPLPLKTETTPGVVCELLWRALNTVGLYIPGGTASLFSAVLMQAIPARIAGCNRVILCSPPQPDGTIPAPILFTASLCGITEIYAVGGAQAIAAMAYGTLTIPKVDKIFGPGNAYVTAAKQQISQDSAGTAIDMPAGPSEVLVIAEQSAHADWVAADLLAQAEHDPSAQAILVTTSAAFAEYVQGEIKKQLSALPRNVIAAQAIAHSRIIIVADIATAIEVSNTYAPEHLIIHNDDAARYLGAIQHAGSVFLGALTPESAGDYASGTNHVLPTYGYARAYSGLTVLSFMKSMTVQTLTLTGLQNLAPTLVAMAKAEGLDAHATAVSIRLEHKS